MTIEARNAFQVKTKTSSTSAIWQEKDGKNQTGSPVSYFGYYTDAITSEKKQIFWMEKKKGFK